MVTGTGAEEHKDQWLVSRLSHSKKMLSASAVNSSIIINNVRTWLVSRVFHSGQAGVTSSGAKADDLPRQKRLERFARTVMGPLLYVFHLLEVSLDVSGFEHSGDQLLLCNRNWRSRQARHQALSR